MQKSRPVEELLAERRGQHGEYLDNVMYSQAMKKLFKTSPFYDEMEDLHRETLDYYAVKIARILSGGYNNPDNWDDTEGYSRLTSDRLPRERSHNAVRK